MPTSPPPLVSVRVIATGLSLPAFRLQAGVDGRRSAWAVTRQLALAITTLTNLSKESDN